MTKITGPIRCWHFACDDRKLHQARESHGRIVEVVPGLTLGEPRHLIMPRECGLHASIRPLDALGYAYGSYVSRVELRGRIIDGGDKLCASWRRHLWCADADAVLREFARWCALRVIHLWDCPDVVRRYLETGDESIRDAARAAACDAARAAACDAARAAACDAAGAAWAVARAVAGDAAAAWDAARAAQDNKLTELLLNLAPEDYREAV